MAHPYGSGPLRSREGLTSRPAGNSDEIQLQIDPIHGDLDDHITGLHQKIRKLKGACNSLQHIEIDYHFVRDAWTKKVVIFQFTPSSKQLADLLTKVVLPQVAQEIETEAKFQNDFISQLQMTLIKAQAGVKNNMRRMNKSIIQNGSNHVLHVILFALFCFFVVYFLSKFSK